MRRRAGPGLAGLAVAVALGAPAAARAHGGAVASAFVLDPEAPGVVVDEAFAFRWFDASDVDAATEDTTHSFFYTPFLPPPWSGFVEPDGLEGTPIAVDVPERDPENRWVWDTREVPPGAYWIWSIADDPDIEFPAQTIVFSPFPVVVAHAGDAPAPFAVLQTPDNPASVARAERFLLEYAVFDPDRSAQLTLERALEEESGAIPTAWTPVEAELSAPIDGFEGQVELDTSSWPVGDHVLRVRLEDGAGRRFSAFARYTLRVFRRPAGPDAGVDAGGGGEADAGGVARPADAGPATPGPGREGASGCGATGAAGPPSLVLALAAAISGISRRRGRKSIRSPR